MHERTDKSRREAVRSNVTLPGWLSVVICASLAGGSCGDDTSYDLHTADAGASADPEADASDTDEPELTEDEEELRRRMAVKVVNRQTGTCTTIACGLNKICVNPTPMSNGDCDVDDDNDADPDAECCFPVEEELDELAVANDFMNACENEFQIQSGFDSAHPTAGTVCSTWGKRLTYPPVCAAGRLLDAAGLRSEPLRYTVQGNFGLAQSVPRGTIREIFPQNSASRVSLAIAAFRTATHAVRRSDAYIRSSLAYATPTGSIANAPCTEAGAESVASDLVTAYHLAKEATDLAVENTLAVADSFLSSTPSERERNTLAYLGAVLSRSAAAHLLVGGKPGLPTSTGAANDAFSWGGEMQFAMCSQPQLTPQAETALKTFREAAVSPLDMIDPALDLNILVNRIGTEGVGPRDGGSVLERLRELWASEALDSTSDVSDVLGLKMDDFQEARDYMSQEIRMFRRSTTAFLPPRELAGGDLTDFKRWAATATPAPQRNPMYWVTVAQHMNYGVVNSADQPYGTIGLADARKARFSNVRYYTDLYIENGISSLGTVGDEYPLAVAQYGLAGFIDLVAETATNLISIIEIAPTYNPNVTRAMQNGLMDPLLLLLTDVRRERPGRLRVQASTTGPSVEAACFGSADGLLLVAGEDGLACAVDGSIEGAGCNLSGALALSSQVAITHTAGCATAARATFPAGGLVPEQHYYLVQPLEPGRIGPGNYKSLGSFVAPKAQTNLGTGDASRRFVPLVPDLADRAARVLAPSRKWCSRPLVSCIDESFDARLPLEDELTDDGDSVESSWKYYLELAKQAADEADMLGESVVNLSLDTLVREEQKQIRQIQRAEPAVQELQDICGIDVDPTVLLRALSADGSKDFNGLRGPVCTTNSNCTGGATCRAGRCTRTCTTDATCTEAGSKCVAGICAVDPLQFVMTGLGADAAITGDASQLERLGECLSDTQLERHVTPGSDPLCIWERNGAPNYVCEGAGPENPCPSLAGVGTRDMPLPPNCSHVVVPAGNTVKLVTSQLNFFDANAQGPQAPTAGLCDDIRSLRLTPGNQELLNKIENTNFFDPDALENISRRIEWHTYAGGYSNIVFGGRLVGATDINANRWPCDATKRAEACLTSPVSGAGLFCMTGNCADAATRANMNHRMRNAVIAARDMTISDGIDAMDGVVLPVLLRRDGDYSVEGQGGRWIRGSNWYEPNIINGVNHQNIWSFVAPVRKNNTYGGAWAFDCLANPAECAVPLWTLPGPIDFYDGYPKPGGGSWTVGFGAVGRLSRGGRLVGDQVFEIGIGNFDPGHWFSGLTFNPKYSGTPPNKTVDNQHRDFLYNQLAGHERPYVSSGPGGSRSLDTPEPLVVDAGMWEIPLIGTLLNLDGGVQAHALTGGGVEMYRRTKDTMLDGMELICEVEVGSEGGCGAPPVFSSAHELKFAAKYLECVATDIRQKAAYGVLFDFPVRAFDALREAGALGSFPRVGGRMGESISSLRGSLVSLSTYSTALADTISQLAHDLRTLQRNLEIGDLESELREVNFASTVSTQLSACAASAGGITSPGAAFSSAATCANSLAQIHFAKRIKALEGEIAEIGTEQQIADFQQQFEDRVGEFDDISVGITEAQESLDAQLAALETLRRQGHRALAKALFMDSSIVEAEAKYDVASFLRLNTARVRFDEARKGAQRMSFFARRAIEQRLGVDLSTMHEQLPLVDAPSGWVDKVCESSGYDFNKAVEVGSKAEELGNYADVYIGDYVNKLENLVESYRQTHNFHEGTDMAVISLRDDVKNSRALCSVPVANLLYEAGQLDALQTTDDEGEIVSPGWTLMGCEMDETTGLPLANCVQPVKLQPSINAMGEDINDPIAGPRPEMSDTAGYLVRFGPQSGTCALESCGFRQTTAVGQEVSLLAGRYRLSWYGKDGGNDPASSLAVRFEDDTNWTILNPVVEPTSGEWSRYYDEFLVTEEQSITVAVIPATLPNPSQPAMQQVYIAAPMLEDVTRSETASPRYFANTSFILEQDLPLCEDTTGEVFRRQFWKRGCMQICSDGFAAACSDTNAELRCYRELTFSIDPRSVESGNALSVAGFATGNFNYRIESLGLNMVGTGTRNCESSETPSSCFAGGFIPFSLEHLGPYRVRNYQGADTRVELFPGIIEHARGLAAERYLTNPLSSTDVGLIAPYYRSELRGRPLDGHFVLRVWEEEGVDFSKIEDVQLVLNYRYWTRNQ